MRKRIKKIFILIIAVLTACSFSTTAFATESKEVQAVFDVELSPTISFALYHDETLTQQTRSKNYVEDSYEGYFYLTATGQRISTHKLVASFSYDGTLTTCYAVNATREMDRDYTGNLKPEVKDSGRSTITSTLAYGYATFVLYNADDSINTEVTVHIYCNQDGETWIDRQG